MISISIIVATYNRPNALRDTLLSFQSLDPGPLEILVVDQSESPPADHVAWLSAHQAEHREVRWIRHSPPNAQGARNRGIREARGDVVLFVDDDVEVPADLVGRHWSNYVDPHLAAVSGMILEPGESPVHELPARCNRSKIGWIYAPLNYGVRSERINLSSCNCSIRREHALAVGGFDENFTRTLFDDTDLAWRLHVYCREKCLKVVHDPQAWLTHLRVQNGGNRPGRRNEFVVADANAWYTWCYFHFQHACWESFRTLMQRYRWWVWHRKNILRPWWLVSAHREMLAGMLRARRAITAGPRLLPGDKLRSEAER